MKHETPIDLWLYEKEAFADGFQLVCMNSVAAWLTKTAATFPVLKA